MTLIGEMGRFLRFTNYFSGRILNQFRKPFWAGWMWLSSSFKEYSVSRGKEYANITISHELWSLCSRCSVRPLPAFYTTKLWIQYVSPTSLQHGGMLLDQNNFGHLRLSCCIFCIRHIQTHFTYTKDLPGDIFIRCSGYYHNKVDGAKLLLLVLLRSEM